MDKVLLRIIWSRPLPIVKICKYLLKSSIFSGWPVSHKAECETGTSRWQKSKLHNHILSGKTYFLKKYIFFMTKFDFRKSTFLKIPRFEILVRIYYREPYSKSLLKSKKLETFPNHNFENEISPWKNNIFWSGFFFRERMDI